MIGSVHKPQRNSAERAMMLATRSANRRNRSSGFTESPKGRIKLSRKGVRTETWMTKAHTKSRKKDLAEYKIRIAEELKKKLASKPAKQEVTSESEVQVQN